MCYFRSEPRGKVSTRLVTRQGKKRQTPDNIKTLLGRKYLLCKYLHLNLLSKVLRVTLVVVGVVGGKADKPKSWRSVTAPTTTRRSSLFVCLEILEPVCLSQDLFNQWSGQPLPNVFSSLWKERLFQSCEWIFCLTIFTFSVFIDCFPFYLYLWCEGVGDCITPRLVILAWGWKLCRREEKEGVLGVKTLVCLSPPSPHPSCCARAASRSIYNFNCPQYSRCWSF